MVQAGGIQTRELCGGMVENHGLSGDSGRRDKTGRCKYRLHFGIY